MEEELEGDDDEEDGGDGEEGRGRVSVDSGWAVISELHGGGRCMNDSMVAGET